MGLLSVCVRYTGASASRWRRSVARVEPRYVGPASSCPVVTSPSVSWSGRCCRRRPHGRLVGWAHAGRVRGTLGPAVISESHCRVSTGRVLCPSGLLASRIGRPALRPWGYPRSCRFDRLHIADIIWACAAVRRENASVPTISAGPRYQRPAPAVTAPHDLSDSDGGSQCAVELGASDARQRAIVDAALDRVVISDEHGRVTYSNKSAEQTFGYPGSEAIGRELADVIVPARGETLIGDGSRNI